MKILRPTILAFLLVFLFLLDICSGWRYFSKPSTEKSTPIPDMDEAYMLTNTERDTRVASMQDRLENMFGISFKDEAVVDRGLQTFRALQSKNDDCFKAAARSLQKGCQSFSITQDEKIQYALQLTLCELATANIPIPPICRKAAHDSETDPDGCISQLANIPQTWTSYSGYFRDAELMCQALRYRLDRELLEQLHRNITIHQLHHFHLLREQQKCLLDWRREEINALEAIRQAQSKLWDLFEKHVIEAQARTAKEIFDLMDLVEQQQQDMADWSKEQIDQLGLYFQEATKEVLEKASQQLQLLQEGIQYSYNIQKSSVDDLLYMQTIQKNITDDLTGLSSQVKDSLQQMLNETASLVDILKYDIDEARIQFTGFLGTFQRVSSMLHLGSSTMQIIAIATLGLFLGPPLYSILHVIVLQHLHTTRVAFYISILAIVTLLTVFKYASTLHLLLLSRGQTLLQLTNHNVDGYHLLSSTVLFLSTLLFGVITRKLLRRKSMKIVQYKDNSKTYAQGLQDSGIQDNVIAIDPLNDQSSSNERDEGKEEDFVRRLQVLYDML